MKLFVLGATGGTGVRLVSQALDAGHDVTVLARDGSKITTQHPRLETISGDTTAGGATLAGAMRDHDAVISAIGRGKTFKSDNLIARSVPRLLSAMQACVVLCLCRQWVSAAHSRIRRWFRRSSTGRCSAIFTRTN